MPSVISSRIFLITRCFCSISVHICLHACMVSLLENKKAKGERETVIRNSYIADALVLCVVMITIKGRSDNYPLFHRHYISLPCSFFLFKARARNDIGKKESNPPFVAFYCSFFLSFSLGI